MEDQKRDELVEQIKDGLEGMYLKVLTPAPNYVKIGIAASVGSAVGTGAYLGVLKLIGFTKRKLRERKIEQETSKGE